MPCAILDPGGAYCTRLSQGLVFAGYYIVGFGTMLTSSGRRLLGIEMSNVRYHNNTGPDRAPNTTLMSFAVSVPTHNALCRDALTGWVWAVEHDRHFELRDTAEACAQTANFSHATSALVLMRYNVSLPPCAFCSMLDASQAFGDMYNLPLGAWILILQRHNFLVSPAFMTKLGNHLPPMRMLQVLKHDVAGHVALAIEHIFPDPSTTTLASVRRFFAKRPDPAPGGPKRQTLSASGLVEYFDELQASVLDDSLTQSYAQLVSTSWQSNLPPLSPEQLAAWQLQWPPRFVADADESCSFASKWLALGRRAADSVTAAKQASNARARECVTATSNVSANVTCRPKSNLSDAWPKLLNSDDIFSAQESKPVAGFLTGIVVDASFSLLSAIGVQSKLLRDFIYSVLDTISSQFKCDIEAVQTCSEWRVNLWMGTVVVGVLYSLLFAICNTLSLTLLAVAAVPFFPFFVWHVCYGYQLLCAPTIPACVLADTRATMQALLPPQIQFPLPLLRNTPECTADANRYTVSDECILPCSEEPLLYTSWHPVMAWWAAEVGMQALVKDDASLFPSDLIDYTQLELSISLKEDDLVAGGDLASANRICAALHGYRLLPYIFLIGVIVGLALFMARFAVTLFFSMIMFVTKLFVYSITEADT